MFDVPPQFAPVGATVRHLIVEQLWLAGFAARCTGRQVWPACTRRMQSNALSGGSEKFLELGKSRSRIFFWKEIPAIKRLPAHLKGFISPGAEDIVKFAHSSFRSPQCQKGASILFPARSSSTHSSVSRCPAWNDCHQSPIRVTLEPYSSSGLLHTRHEGRP